MGNKPGIFRLFFSYFSTELQGALLQMLIADSLNTNPSNSQDNHMMLTEKKLPLSATYYKHKEHPQTTLLASKMSTYFLRWAKTSVLVSCAMYIHE